MKTKIIGCGNPIAGDDGLGVHVIKELKTMSLPEEVILLEGGTDPIALLEMLRETEKVVLVDGLKGAGHPGEIFILRPDQLDLKSDTGLSLHQFNLAHVLSLGYTLYPDEMPQDIVIAGVEVLDTTPCNPELSPPVKHALPQMLQIILKEIATGLKE